MFSSAKQIFLGAALLSALPLYAAETSSNSGAAAPAHAYINCPGISAVPMTADAEQSLPLQQIAALPCGEAVAVLSDEEGYTAHVRTEQGKEGYVARRYLTKAAGPAQPHDEPAAQPNTATPQNGVVRWNAGAPGCDQFSSQGRHVESVTVNGITVQVSLQDTGWKLRATVAVSNNSGAQVYVLPALITLDELKPSLRNLRQQDPRKLSHSEANHQLLRDEASAQPSPSAVAYRSGSSATLSSVSFRASAAPNYLNSATDEFASVQSVALKNVNLAPGQKASGALWFARSPNANELSMRLSVGDLVFDFPFSFTQK